jgi:DNA modification methylase
MVADAVLDCTKRGDIVLDAYLGSGTTLMAAERVGRICYAIELDRRYVDAAIQRWQRLTGESAIHAEAGKSYAEVAADREVPCV